MQNQSKCRLVSSSFRTAFDIGLSDMCISNKYQPSLIDPCGGIVL